MNGRKDHYNLQENRKIYLTDELNLLKIHTMYNEAPPSNKVSYEAYRNYLDKNLNITFEYPKVATNFTCDEFQAEREHLETKITS